MESRTAVVLFEDTPIRREFIDNEYWIAAIDVAKALKYDNPSRAVNDMIKNNAELFEGYERFVVLKRGRSKQNIRVFNARGVIAFCIKSNKTEAIKFQRWAVAELEKKVMSIPTDIRMVAKQKRILFTDTLKDHGCTKPHHYINITKDMKKELDITVTQKRKDCDLIEVMKIAVSEDLARINMIQNDSSGYVDCRDASLHAAHVVKENTQSQIKNDPQNQGSATKLRDMSKSDIHENVARDI